MGGSQKIYLKRLKDKIIVLTVNKSNDPSAEALFYSTCTPITLALPSPLWLSDLLAQDGLFSPLDR